MKKLSLIIIVLIGLINTTIQAQTLYADNSTCSDMDLIIVAIDGSCNVVGAGTATIPAGTTLTAATITWSTDPAMCSCTWYFDQVHIATPCLSGTGPGGTAFCTYIDDLELEIQYSFSCFTPIWNASDCANYSHTGCVSPGAPLGCGTITNGITGAMAAVGADAQLFIAAH